MSVAWKRPLETPKAIFDGQLTPYRLQLWLRTHLLLLGSVYRISYHSDFHKHVFLHGSECDAMLERLSYVLRVSSPRCHCTATLSQISSSTLFAPLTILVYIYIYIITSWLILSHCSLVCHQRMCTWVILAAENTFEGNEIDILYLTPTYDRWQIFDPVKRKRVHHASRRRVGGPAIGPQDGMRSGPQHKLSMLR